MSQPSEPPLPGPAQPPGGGPAEMRAGEAPPTAAAETSATPQPGEVGAGRRLDRPPGERLAAAPAGSPETASMAVGSPARAVAMGIVGAVIGVAVFLVLSIGFSYSAGLVIVAIFTGRFVGLFVRAGAAGTLSSPARTLVAIVIFLAALAAATVLTWLWARLEGGDLGLADYLNEVYGVPIVALEFMLGTLMAWWSAR